MDVFRTELPGLDLQHFFHRLRPNLLEQERRLLRIPQAEVTP